MSFKFTGKSLVHKGRHKNWRERAVMALYHVGKLFDACVFFLSASFLNSDLGAEIMFSERLENWREGNQA